MKSTLHHSHRCAAVVLAVSAAACKACTIIATAAISTTPHQTARFDRDQHSQVKAIFEKRNQPQPDAADAAKTTRP
jgi:hypothetical protein